MKPFDFNQLVSEQKQLPITWLIIAVSFAPFLLLKSGDLNTISAWFMPSKLTMEVSWKLLTPSFIHYTELHLLTNIIVWWLFATRLEHHSTRDLVLLFIISAAFSNYCQWIMTGTEFGGLSGVNYALLGYLLVGDKLAGIQQFRLDPALSVLLLLLIPLGFSEQLGKLANFAHIGGLFIGSSLAAINFLVLKDK